MWVFKKEDNKVRVGYLILGFYFRSVLTVYIIGKSEDDAINDAAKVVSYLNGSTKTVKINVAPLGNEIIKEK